MSSHFTRALLVEHDSKRSDPNRTDKKKLKSDHISKIKWAGLNGLYYDSHQLWLLLIKFANENDTTVSFYTNMRNYYYCY